MSPFWGLAGHEEVQGMLTGTPLNPDDQKTHKSQKQAEGGKVSRLASAQAYLVEAALRLPNQKQA